MNILVTGSSGFIGAKLISSLNTSNYNVYASDLSNKHEHNNFISIEKNIHIISNMDVVVHLGAISETTYSNKKNIFDQNISNTINILNHLPKSCKLIFASSASVYGQMGHRNDQHVSHNDLSLYAKSKLFIDSMIENFFDDRKVISLRFFNVCSFFDEQYKKQPSPTFKFLKQLEENNRIYLFHGSENIYRDFIFIDDIIDVIKFFIDNNQLDIERKQKIIDVGSGIAVSFESIADALIDVLGRGEKSYINNPNSNLFYQKYTCADISILRSVGYSKKIPSIIDYIKLLKFYLSNK